MLFKSTNNVHIPYLNNIQQNYVNVLKQIGHYQNCHFPKNCRNQQTIYFNSVLLKGIL